MAHPNIHTEKWSKSQNKRFKVSGDVLIIFFLTAFLLMGCVFDLSQRMLSQGENGGSLSGDIMMLVYSYDDPGRTLAAYIYNSKESEVWLPAGSYHAEVKLVDNTMLSFSPLIVPNEKNGKGKVNLKAQLLEPIESKEASQQIDTLVRFLVAVDNVRLTYFEIVSNGFSESLFSNTTDLSWPEETILMDAFSNLGDQVVINKAAQGFVSRAENLTADSQKLSGLSLSSPGLIDNILTFFSIADEEDERAREEILAMYNAIKHPWEKEEAFLALDENQLAGAKNFDEFIQKIRNGEIEDHLSIRRDLMTLGPMEGIMMDLNPDSNRPGGEAIHRVGGEAIRRGAELNVEVIKTVLSSSFPGIDQGFDYADRANEWAEYINQVYTDPVNTLGEAVEGQAEDIIKEPIKLQFQMLFPEMDESDVDQYVNDIVEQISDTAEALNEIADNESSSGESNTIIDSEESTANADEQWDIYQCNAMQEVTINLNNFNEQYYRLQTDNNILCDYNYKITNEGDQPIRLIHYEQLFPSEEYDTPSRWVPFTVIQPEGYSIVYGWIDQCNDATPSRHETFTFSVVLVYEIPECRWITEGENIHIDILHIAEEEPVLAPCTLLSPISYSESVPDISEGLRP